MADFGIWALADPLLLPLACLVLFGIDHAIVKQQQADGRPLRVVVGGMLISTLPATLLCLLVIGLLAEFAFNLPWTTALMLTVGGEALILMMQTAFRSTGASRALRRAVARSCSSGGADRPSAQAAAGARPGVLLSRTRSAGRGPEGPRPAADVLSASRRLRGGCAARWGRSALPAGWARPGSIGWDGCSSTKSSLRPSRLSSCSRALALPVAILSVYLPPVFWSTISPALSRPLSMVSPRWSTSPQRGRAGRPCP